MGHTIGKRFRFSASHALTDLPPGHKCARLHGHNYIVEVTIRADQLVAPGFVTDFADLAPFGAYLEETFDHRHLNDVMPQPPTSENIATFLADWFVQNIEPNIHGRLAAIRVCEGESTWAQYVLERDQ